MMAAIHLKMSYIRKVNSSVDFYNALAEWDRQATIHNPTETRFV